MSVRLPARLIALLADARVEQVFAERCPVGGGVSYWVELRAGFYSPCDETHVIHETTVRDVLDKMRGVRACDCTECSQCCGLPLPSGVGRYGCPNCNGDNA